MKEKNESVSLKRTARITGLLFIVATTAAILSSSLTGPIFHSAEYLANVSENGNKIMIGALLSFLAAVTSAGIAISLYPVLEKYSRSLAMGAVGFRLIEAVFYIIGIVCMVMLFPLSKEFVKAGAGDSTYFNTIGNLLLNAKDLSGFVFGASSFCLGAMMYYYVLYKSRLVPRWLSVWGLIAIVLLLTVTLSNLLGGAPFEVSGNMLFLVFPIFLQEIVLAVWLIVKGFNVEVAVKKSVLNERISVLSLGEN